MVLTGVTIIAIVTIFIFFFLLLEISHAIKSNRNLNNQRVLLNCKLIFQWKFLFPTVRKRNYQIKFILKIAISTSFMSITFVILKPKLKYVIWGNVLSVKCPFAELIIRELSVREIPIREMYVGEQSVKELSEYRQDIECLSVRTIVLFNFICFLIEKKKKKMRLAKIYFCELASSKYFMGINFCE